MVPRHNRTYRQEISCFYKTYMVHRHVHKSLSLDPVLNQLKQLHLLRHTFLIQPPLPGDCGSTVVKVLCYKSEGRWFDPSWCRGFFTHKILPIALWPGGRLSL